MKDPEINAMAAMARALKPFKDQPTPCPECGDESFAGEMCRDCAIEEAFEDGRCKDCGWFCTNGLLWPQETHDPMTNCPWMAL